MAISVPAVSQANFTTNNGTGPTVTFPTASMAAGDWIYLIGGHFYRSGQSIGPNPIGDWQEVYAENAGGSTNAFGVWRKLWDGSEVNVATYGSGTNGDACIYGRIILRGSSAVREVAPATGSSTNPNPDTVATVAGDCVLIAAQSAVTDTSPGTVSNYTTVNGNVNTTNDMSMSIGYRLNPGTSENPANWSAWATGNWRALSIVVTPARLGALAASESGPDSAAIAVAVALSGSVAATESGSDTSGLVGGVLVAGALSAAESGADTAAITGTVSDAGTIGIIAATEAGADSMAAAAAVAIAGNVSAVEAANDNVAVSGAVEISGALVGSETGPDFAAAIGAASVYGLIDAFESGGDVAAATGAIAVIGALAATESGSDTFRATETAGAQGATGSLVATESGDDLAVAIGLVSITGVLTASEVGSDIAATFGSVSAAGYITAGESGVDTSEIAGAAIVSGSLSAADTADQCTTRGMVVVLGSLAASDNQPDVFASSGVVFVLAKNNVDLRTVTAETESRVANTIGAGGRVMAARGETRVLSSPGNEAALRARAA